MADFDDSTPAQPTGFDPVWNQPPISEVPAEGVHPAQAYQGPPESGEPQPWPAGQPPAQPWLAGQPPAQPWLAGQPPAQNWQPATPPRRHRTAKVLSILAAALVLIVGAGGLLAFRALHSSGNDPEQVVPADVVAFAKLDLDPSASQKIAAMRFLGKLPNVGSTFNTGTDLKKNIIESAIKSGGNSASVSYDRDIKPWLGDRVAVAVRPGVSASSPDVVVAAQAKDSAKAESAVRSLAGRFLPSQFGVATYKGYVLLSQSQAGVDRAVIDAKISSLSSNSTFRADVKALGDAGVASGWADYNKLASLAGPNPYAKTFAALGTISFAVHFTNDTVEAVVKQRSTQQGSVSRQPVADIGSLPAGTAAAFELGGAGASATKAFNSLSGTTTAAGGTAADFADSYRQLAKQYGLTLPDDLQTLLGTDLTFALSPEAIYDRPVVGVRIKTDGAAAAATLDRVKAAIAANLGAVPVTWATTASGIVVSNDPGYLQTLQQPAAAPLSSTEAFKRALPDAASSVASGYLDLQALATAAEQSGESAADVKTLRSFSSFGMTVTVAPTAATIRLRLVAR